MCIRAVLCVLTCTLASANIALASTQTFPSGPITIVAPYAAGGPTDTLARIIAEGMARSLGYPVIVENLPGAAGSIGVARVVRAKPDGHTLNIGNWGTNVVNGAVRKLKYDLLADLEPISLLANNPHMIVSRSSVPAADLAQLIAWVRANPDKVSSGHSGAGSGSHISGLYFQRETGTRFPFAAYRGAGPILQSLMAGHIDVFFDQVSNSLPYLSTGKIRAYAVAAKSRVAAAPDIPTTDEAGLPGFHVSIWHALWAPKGTSRDVIAKLNAAVVQTLSDPAIRKRLGELGQEIPEREQQTPEALRAFQKAEIEKWWPIIKAYDIGLD